jgi:hypothetical protein
MGTTMTPGFEREDFEAGDAERLATKYTAFDHLIGELA